MGFKVGECAGLGEGGAVGVVAVAGDGFAGGIDQVDHVALQVQDIVIGLRAGRAPGLGRQVQHVGPSVEIVQEVQGIVRPVLAVVLPQKLPRAVGVAVPHPVDLFPGPQAVHVVLKLQLCAGFPYNI